MNNGAESGSRAQSVGLAIPSSDASAVAQVPKPERLPEILLEIMYHLTRVTPLGTVVIDGDALLSFTHVCRLWMGTAVSSSAAWSDMDMLWPKPRVRLWVDRAKHNPLRILLDEPFPGTVNLDQRLRNFVSASSMLTSSTLTVELLSLHFHSHRAVQLLSKNLAPVLGKVKFFEAHSRLLSHRSNANFLHRALSRAQSVTLRRASSPLQRGHPKPYAYDHELLESLHLLEIPLRSTWAGSFRFHTPRHLRQLTVTHIPSRSRKFAVASWRLSEESVRDRRNDLPILETLCLGAPGDLTEIIALDTSLPRLHTLLIGDNLEDQNLLKALVSSIFHAIQSKPAMKAILTSKHVQSLTCSSVVSLRLAVKHAMSFLNLLYAPHDNSNPTARRSESKADKSRENLSLFPSLVELQVGPFPQPFHHHVALGLRHAVNDDLSDFDSDDSLDSSIPSLEAIGHHTLPPDDNSSGEESLPGVSNAPGAIHQGLTPDEANSEDDSDDDANFMTAFATAARFPAPTNIRSAGVHHSQSRFSTGTPPSPQPTAPESLHPGAQEDEALNELITLFADDGGLCALLAGRTSRGYPKLQRLHVQVPAVFNDMTQAQLEKRDVFLSKIKAKAWLERGVETVMLDDSEPWTVWDSKASTE